VIFLGKASSSVKYSSLCGESWNLPYQHLNSKIFS